MPKKPTLHDVAQAAGVSPRTVSRVVNDESGFSEATRRRVLSVIDSLGYRPNLAARTLVTRRTNTLALVVANLTDPFFPDVAESVITAARSRGYTTLVATTGDDPAREAEVLDSLVSRAVDAAIVFPTFFSDAFLRELADDGLPLVSVDHTIEHPGIGVVASDIRRGPHLAVGHLVARGHQCIAMFANERSPRRWRETSYLAAMEDAGLSAGSVVIHADPTIEGGKAAARRLLEQDADVSAVVTYNDVMAVGALAEFRAAGQRVPEDVALVGFDDIPLTEFTTPAITTVRLDRQRVGREAVAMALALSSNGGAPIDPVVVPVSLVVRASS